MRAEKGNLPVLSSTTAALLSIIFTLVYVLPFYLLPTTRPSVNLSRDAPSVIRARIRLVSLSVTACSAVTMYILVRNLHISPQETLHLLGWYPVSVSDIARVMLLTACLFAGPLFEKGIVESGWRDWIRGESLYENLSGWIGWRNYVAGPVTEEINFRSLLIPLHLTLPPSRIILITPLYFAIAHIHHFYEYTLTHQYAPLLPALLRTLFQFMYTTVFGWYATFVFLRTGSLPAVVLAHAFCNWCGVPRLWGRVERVEWSDGIKEEGDMGIGWSVAYYMILVAGLVGFQRWLRPLTESQGALVEI